VICGAEIRGPLYGLEVWGGVHEGFLSIASAYSVESGILDGNFDRIEASRRESLLSLIDVVFPKGLSCCLGVSRAKQSPILESGDEALIAWDSVVHTLY
jgi:hypothetical protein